jgi:lantibiotic modifying enzyme
MTATIQKHSVLLTVVLCICWTEVGLVANAGPAELKKQESVSAQEVLELAEDVGRWLANHATVTPAGTTWPDNVLDPTAVSYDLASGVAGKVLYFTALYRATGNANYLQLAQGGADYLVGILQNPALFDENPRRASLYTGISGIGVALLHVQEHLSDPRYGQTVVQITERLGEWSVVEG